MRHFPLRPLLMYSRFPFWLFGLFVFLTFRYAALVVKRKTERDFFKRTFALRVVFVIAVQLIQLLCLGNKKPDQSKSLTGLCCRINDQIRRNQVSFSYNDIANILFFGFRFYFFA